MRELALTTRKASQSFAMRSTPGRGDFSFADFSHPVGSRHRQQLTVKFTMLGVSFLDVDFMRINFACASDVGGSWGQRAPRGEVIRSGDYFSSLRDPPVGGPVGF